MICYIDAFKRALTYFVDVGFTIVLLSGFEEKLSYSTHENKICRKRNKLVPNVVVIGLNLFKLSY